MNHSQTWSQIRLEKKKENDFKQMITDLIVGGVMIGIIVLSICAI